VSPTEDEESMVAVSLCLSARFLVVPLTTGGARFLVVPSIAGGARSLLFPVVTSIAGIPPSTDGILIKKSNTFTNVSVPTP